MKPFATRYAFAVGTLAASVAVVGCGADSGDGPNQADPDTGIDTSAAAPLCSNTCEYASDGDCDDGGPGSDFSVCEFGTDCNDCGPRQNDTQIGDWQRGEEAATIGPEGGVLQVGDVLLTVPAGAFDSENAVQLNVHLPTDVDVEGLTIVSPVVEINADFLGPFALPVRLEFPFESEEAPVVYRAESMVAPFLEFPSGQATNGVVSASLESFSAYLAASPALGSGEASFIVDGVSYASNPEIGPSFPLPAQQIGSMLGAGRLWYHPDHCIAFLSHGAGHLDELGGWDDPRIPEQSRVQFGPSPGESAPAVWSPVANLLGPPNPDFQRWDHVRNFEWGLRLTSDGQYYVDSFGRHELGLLFDDGEFVSGDYDSEAPARFELLQGASETNDGSQHTCVFREHGASTPEEHNLPVCYTESISSGDLTLCYLGGELHGTLELLDGENALMRADFEDGFAHGSWMSVSRDGNRAAGTFESGSRTGQWEFDRVGTAPRDYPVETVTLAGWRDGPLGPYEVVDGAYVGYWTIEAGYGRRREAGLFADGLRTGPWTYYSEAGEPGGVLRIEEYDASRTRDAGSTCGIVDDQEVCVDRLRSLIVREHRYVWGTCVTGLNYRQTTEYDVDGVTVTETRCVELLGSPQEPEVGPEMESCPAACET